MWNVNLFMRFSRWTTYDELIETLWNVNAISVLDCAFNASRINRNIVECKFSSLSLCSLHIFRINRNIVECKLKSLLFIYLKPFRINRNIVECKSKYCSDSFCKQIELIETLWNVNKFTNVKFDSNSWINRNIVECKWWCKCKWCG